VREEFGSVTNFLLNERLRWNPLPSSSGPDAPFKFEVKNPVPFADRTDYRILRNDWPYGWEPNLTHVCVWLKAPLPVTGDTGQLTKEGEAMVERFVDETFVKGLGLEGQDKVQWFKNWTILQSVRAVEHCHVIFRDVDAETLDRVVERLPSLPER
jgi:hypothetical protein